MVAVKLSAIVGEDRRLIVDLPDDVPPGRVELIVRPVETSPGEYSRFDDVRSALLAADFLVTAVPVPEDAADLTQEAVFALGQRPAGTRSSAELLREERD
jgi:hypothetical protein